MKSLRTIILSGILLAGTWVHGDEVEFNAAETAQAMAENLDRQQLAIRDALAEIAGSKEAMLGEWSAIESLLGQASEKADLTGAWFYILPDGNYYSLGKGLTKLNLSDRSYFGSLFAGTAVKGYPLVSRSTGQKSAFFAAPVIVDGRVTGAMAASIFLDGWHQQLGASVSLPADYTWFVVNWRGETILDREKEYIFMNVSQQGSPSLQKGVRGMYEQASGSFDYEIGGTGREAVFHSLTGIDWRLVLARVSSDADAVDSELKLRLTEVRNNLQAKLNQMDAAISEILAPRQRIVTETGELRAALAELIARQKLFVDAAFVTPDDIMTMIEPSDYRGFEGSDLSESRRTEIIREKGGPIMTETFVSVEGDPGFSISHPVYSASGELLGSVSVLLNPSTFFESVIGSSLPPDHEVWAMQLDGKIVYDANPEEVGRMLFTDPLYVDAGNLLELGRRMIDEPTGQGNYVFASATTGESTIKVAEWDTVSLHGTEWRVILIRRPYDE